MRKIYFVLAALFISFHISGQTNPAPKSIPYTEDFSALLHTSTAYPAGWAGWTIATSPGASFNTNAPTADRTLTASGSASSTAGNVYNYNGKIGYLNTGSLDLTVVLALNTTGKTSIQIAYDIMTIRNPYDGASNTRINEVTLQYRVGTSGSFTNLTGLEYQNNTTTQTGSGITTPQNSQTKNITLPAACDNQAVVQIRWASRQVSGAGSRPSFAVDNINVTGSNISLEASVTATSNVQEPGTNGSFTINLSGPAPAGGTIVSYSLAGTASAGSDFTDPQAGSITIAEGNNSAIVNMNATDDAFTEPTETIILALTGATNGVTINSAPATIQVLDNESSSVLHTTYNSCTALPVEGFTAYSVTGAEVWGCTAFGYNSSNGLQMNGFNAGNQLNEDWLISPALNLSATNIPLLFFQSRNKFAGDQLKLFVSTNYSGSGDPNLATWTEINGDFPAANTDVWKHSQNINLSAFKTTGVYIAFRYTSNTTASARWTVDEVNIVNASVAPASSITTYAKLLDFRFTANGGSSASKSFTFWGNNLTADLFVTAPAGFQLSKDNTTFTGSVSYTTAELNTEKTLYVRYTPTGINLSQYGTLSFTSTGLISSLNYQAVFVKGNSYPTSSTVNIVNYNLEWFGGANGPVDDDLQRDNAITVLNYLDPDIIALEEIVDVTRFNALVSGLSGGYASFLSEYCSNGTTPAACASSQKLAFVYKTGVVSNVFARPMNLNGANWASGRVPYVVTANITKNGQTRAVTFFVLHGKAGSTLTDYNQRLNGSIEMKDSLDAFFNNRNVIILGDLNDDLDVSIYNPGTPQPTSYTTIVSDSTDADRYKSVTLYTLSQFGLSSTATNPEVIDHVIISNELESAYVPFSSTLYDDIGALAGVTNYSTTTSDHFPVMSRYLFSPGLPVRLLSFDAVKQGSYAKLSWRTAEEVNNREFIIERSGDGINYAEIARLPAAGGASTVTDYDWLDTKPLKGRNYYRLKQVDNDNRSHLSRIASVLFNKNSLIAVYPNPATGFIEIAPDLAGTTLVSVQLLDVNGKVVKTQSETTGPGQIIKMNLENISKGLYILKLSYNGTIGTEKLVIQ